MEDVLEVYHRPCDPSRPQVCVDETNKQLVGETMQPLPAEPGQPERFEVHYTPKHGSWLNVAEIELSVLSRQCLDRRIESMAELLRQLEPWEVERNDRAIGVNWRFTTADARIKLRRLYPAVQNS